MRTYTPSAPSAPPATVAAPHPASDTTHKSHHGDPIYDAFHNNATAPRIDTSTVLTAALRKKYPNLHLTITSTYSFDLLGFAAAGHAGAIPSSTAEESQSLEGSTTADHLSSDLKWRRYITPSRRTSDSDGILVDNIRFGRFIYTWSTYNYILYKIVGDHGGYDEDVTYMLGDTAEANDALLLAAGIYWNQLHDQVLVFDGGYWRKDRKLWESVQNSTWDDVILDKEMKKSIIGEMEKFFGSEERYKKLKVPWKRGIIYYGPPGNGKTISIKAMMHTLYHLPSPIPTLYVRSLSAYGGPEAAIASIFSEARKQAPCLLVFEDLDSIITDSVRSYFLNEVDGLESNDGILMVGSTNHLERLDPGISKRPSRFDRKYLFPEPDMEERIAYCEFWRRKLGIEDGDDEGKHAEVEFPMVLCKAIAGITADFSFAYIQEAFVASLLAIAASGDEDDDSDDDGDVAVAGLHELMDATARLNIDYDEQARTMSEIDLDNDLDRYLLWRQMKKQVYILRSELGKAQRQGTRDAL
ncbi:MAG: hypothetical protein Q9181_002285 [Wetmoreana brouardii]